MSGKLGIAGGGLADFHRSLNVDIQHDGSAAPDAFEHFGFQGAVSVREHLGMLNEFIIADAVLKLFTGEKIVVNAVLFADAGDCGWCRRWKIRGRAWAARTRLTRVDLPTPLGPGRERSQYHFAHKKLPKNNK